MNGQRAGAFEVWWRKKTVAGQECVEDVTIHRSRTVRLMNSVRTVFESHSETTTLRTAEGGLLRSHTRIKLGRGRGARLDEFVTRRTKRGYHVTAQVGDNREEFDVASEHPTIVDAESFVGKRIRKGELDVGDTLTMRQLDTRNKRTIEVSLHVEAIEETGLVRIREQFENNRTLWWFDADGTVRRMSAGLTEIRRDDTVTLDSLPRRPATFQVTLPSDIDAPRLFTGRTMVVDLKVLVDETVRLPAIAANPFTRVLSTSSGQLRLELTSHDRAGATTTLPIKEEKFGDYLKPTRVMEVDHPTVVATAQRIVGATRDARTAATKIADAVFHMLVKRSPELGEPSAVQILRDRVGDCSEHALLFTTLCRAAGIPARRCSGWVCIGSDWGAHAWTEIWVGEWIGADPTTNEIGTRARYIMLRRQDEADYPAAHILAERSEIKIVRAEYSDGAIAFQDDDQDDAIRTGIRTAPLPKGWRLRYTQGGAMLNADGVRLTLSIEGDHGYRAPHTLARRYRGGSQAFGNRTAYHARGGRGIVVPLGRQHLYIERRDRGRREIPLAELAKVLEPTISRDE